MYNFPNSVCAQLTPATGNYCSLITSFSRARPLLTRNKSTSLPSVAQRRTEHMTSEHTAGHAQFMEGTFVQITGHFSTAMVPAGIFGEGKQPTAVMCIYEKLAEKQPDTQGSNGLVRCLGWLSLNSNKLTTYLLMSRRLQCGSTKYDVMHLKILKADTRGERIQRAKWPGRLTSV
jgi:hypothetical protein